MEKIKVLGDEEHEGWRHGQNGRVIKIMEGVKGPPKAEGLS